MMRHSTLYSIIFTLLLFSCKENNSDKNNTENKISKERVQWDYLTGSFRNKAQQTNLQMLCMYDTFSLKRINESLFEMHLNEFQGWKKDSKKYIDTLKISDNKKVLDSSGNQNWQILKFSNKNKVDFELSINRRGTDDDSIYVYEYSGKINIDNNQFKYSCKELYVK